MIKRMRTILNEQREFQLYNGDLFLNIFHIIEITKTDVGWLDCGTYHN